MNGCFLSLDYVKNVSLATDWQWSLRTNRCLWATASTCIYNKEGTDVHPVLKVTCIFNKNVDIKFSGQCAFLE